jgi:Fe-S-cluster containining protein
MSSDPGLSGSVPFRFSCTRCGHCCSGGSGHVWLEEGEIPALARALGTSPERFAERHVRRVGERLSLRENENEGGRCALLIGKNTCSVYEARPEHCRRFPYWESVLGDPQAFEAARATCPGIAVVVPDELRARAALALRALYAELDELRRSLRRAWKPITPSRRAPSPMPPRRAAPWARGARSPAAPRARSSRPRSPNACTRACGPSSAAWATPRATPGWKTSCAPAQEGTR